VVVLCLVFFFSTRACRLTLCRLPRSAPWLNLLLGFRFRLRWRLCFFRTKDRFISDIDPHFWAFRRVDAIPLRSFFHSYLYDHEDSHDSRQASLLFLFRPGDSFFGEAFFLCRHTPDLLVVFVFSRRSFLVPFLPFRRKPPVLSWSLEGASGARL